MSKADSPLPRRSQEERRATTVAKLVDATIAAVGEVGYQRATVQEICGRAGLSVGAMFRQFDGRLSLIVRTCQEIAHRRLTVYRTAMAQLDTDADPLRTGLRLLREIQSANEAHALREIYLAARSDDELRARIMPEVERHYATVVAEVEASGVLARFPARLREPLFFLMLHLFSGEAVTNPVYFRPDLADSILDLAMDVLEHYAGRAD